MRRGLLLLVTAAVAAAVIVWWLLPPHATRLQPPADSRVAVGALHIHTTRSDGAGTPAQVADAARRAHLDFVILTDHGDGLRLPDRPRWLSGVLVIDAVEISTSSGHYLALGLAQAPYRLAGEPRDVVEDVRRLGGVGVVAHPDSPKPDLQWHDWSVPFDGLEWLNGDSEWREDSRPALLRALVTYFLRPAESMAALFDRPAQTLARWDGVARARTVVGVAGHDAHARIPLDARSDPGEGRSVGLPTYETAFRTFALRAALAEPLGRTEESAERDAGVVIAAIARGHVYTVIDALAGPALLDFTAQGPAEHAAMGDVLSGAGDVVLTTSLRPHVPGASLWLLRDGRDVAHADGDRLVARHAAGEGSATYRVEARLASAPGDSPVPWIVSNPIYIMREVPKAVERPQIEIETEHSALEATGLGWSVERQTGSDGEMAVAAAEGTAPTLSFTWHLKDGERASQYVALAATVPRGILDGLDRLALRASADLPMRVSVQLRSGGDGRRWQRSVYVDETPRDMAIAFNDFRAVDAPAPATLPLPAIDALLVVVDTVNTPPGRRGTLRISDVRWQRTRTITSSP